MSLSHSKKYMVSNNDEIPPTFFVGLHGELVFYKITIFTNHSIHIHTPHIKYVIQCVPEKRKPVLSVIYLHCRAGFNQNYMLRYLGHFLFFHLIQTHDDISMHDWKGKIWSHACQNRFSQNNGVKLIWPSSD